jgi:hypothetical protein
MEFSKALEARRSIYALADTPAVPDERLIELVAHTIDYTPSAFDSQSQRAVLLLGARHEELWRIVLDALRAIVPAKDFPRSEAKIAAFAAGRGTILFFDDQDVTLGLMASYPLYKDNFAVWYHQHAGMLQGNVWVALAEVGYGASLQHYNELIEAQVKMAFGLPQGWKLLAQMPFGTVVKPAKEKVFQPRDKRFLVLR